TVVIFTSDHGEMLGDHGLWGKGVWYDQACGVPMIIAGPGVETGRRSEALVQFHDIHATVLDYADIARSSVDATVPDSSPSDSISMRPLLHGDARRARAVAVSGLRDWRCAFDGRYKLVAALGEPHRLYDLAADPSEIHDVIAQHQDVALRLASELPELYRAGG
ncbi:MAG TPA: sulfatase-like hydrolase/transferase, partial [Spirochaetia bacterium]|nr:sulfatase-like hydrolase/transferase [Spirochaetia bacterium]